ncbi:hypothetical protein DEO72_LG5g295 [Vigna unguiculata]|uniref:Uncharacterized protein n=1 Tax=Vigna unguiculata TaxID=3917 RepID=A0A4D6LUY2_VIGUN|nr:hypothetical protein DEO72_LG5g295 [Vigna unguiculata]
MTKNVLNYKKYEFVEKEWYEKEKVACTAALMGSTSSSMKKRIVILPERDNNGDAKHERDNNGGAKHEREQRRSTPMEERMQMMKERRMEKMMTEWRTTNANGERRTQTVNVNRPQ